MSLKPRCTFTWRRNGCAWTLAVEDNDRMGKFVSTDSTGNYPVRFNDF